MLESWWAASQHPEEISLTVKGLCFSFSFHSVYRWTVSAVRVGFCIMSMVHLLEISIWRKGTTNRTNRSAKSRKRSKLKLQSGSVWKLLWFLKLKLYCKEDLVVKIPVHWVFHRGRVSQQYNQTLQSWEELWTREALRLYCVGVIGQVIGHVTFNPDLFGQLENTKGQLRRLWEKGFVRVLLLSLSRR